MGKTVLLVTPEAVTLMLRKSGLEDSNTVSTPVDRSVKLDKDDHVSKSTDQVEYQSVVGSYIAYSM